MSFFLFTFIFFVVIYFYKILRFVGRRKERIIIMKKLALILGTVGAALLLTGGVVAAYVIVDNANNQGIHITPGDTVVDRLGKVTLSWGDMTEFTDITHLTAANPVTRSVNVKAETRDEDNQLQADAAYEGLLDVELIDLSGKAENATKLIDFLSVSIEGYAYSNGQFANEKTELARITPQGDKAISVPLHADKNGKQVDFVVTLDASATPVMNDINSDNVYLSVDWNRAAEQVGVKHVYIPDNGWNEMYVYSYKSNQLHNGEWPGVKLERDERTGLFEADLLEHEFFIFSDGQPGTQNRYPADGQPGMTAASLNYDDDTKIYFDWETHTFVADAPQTLAPFYLVGESTAWGIRAEYAFELRDDDKPENAIHQWYALATVEADKDFKIRNDHGNTWLGWNEIEEANKIDYQGVYPFVQEGKSDGNFAFKEAGTYQIFLKQYENGFQIYLARYEVPNP